MVIHKRAGLGDPLAPVGDNTLSGYFVLFEKVSRPSFPTGKWAEVIHRGAWKNVADQIRANASHNPALHLGMTPSTLRLRQDDHGIFAEVDLPDTTYAADLKSLARRGEVEASFEMYDMQRRIERSATGPMIQHVDGFKLLAVSAMPAGGAYQTSLALRDELLDGEQEGMSLDFAEAIFRMHRAL